MPVAKAEREHLKFQAKSLINSIGGPNSAQKQFHALTNEFQAAMGISKERARHYVAKAIRQARAPRRVRKPKKGGKKMVGWHYIVPEEKKVEKKKGRGPGHWGHKGRPGKRGGSLPSKGKAARAGTPKGGRKPGESKAKPKSGQSVTRADGKKGKVVSIHKEDPRWGGPWVAVIEYKFKDPYDPYAKVVTLRDIVTAQEWGKDWK